MSPKSPVEQVHVVNRVLDERASAGLGEVAPPRTGVVATNREELVVAKVCREQGAQPRLRHQFLQDGEDRRVAQHQADLVDDACGFDRFHHAPDFRKAAGERLFAENVESAAGRFDNQRRVL